MISCSGQSALQCYERRREAQKQRKLLLSRLNTGQSRNGVWTLTSIGILARFVRHLDVMSLLSTVGRLSKSSDSQTCRCVGSLGVPNFILKTRFRLPKWSKFSRAVTRGPTMVGRARRSRPSASRGKPRTPSPPKVALDPPDWPCPWLEPFLFLTFHQASFMLCY